MHAFAVGLLLSGQLFEALSFLGRHPTAVRDVFLLSIASTSGKGLTLFSGCPLLAKAHAIHTVSDCQCCQGPSCEKAIPLREACFAIVLLSLPWS